MTLTWKELRVSLVLMNIRDESSHVNLHCFVFLLAKRQVTVLPPSTIISIFRWKWSQKIKSWQKCRSLNICFSHHPKPYKVCIKLYFQNQYKCSIYLAGSMLTWSGDPTRSSPYAAGYQVWFGTSEASSLEMKCINWKWWLSLHPSNPSLIQNQTRKTFPTKFLLKQTFPWEVLVSSDWQFTTESTSSKSFPTSSWLQPTVTSAQADVRRPWHRERNAEKKHMDWVGWLHAPIFWNKRMLKKRWATGHSSI